MTVSNCLQMHARQRILSFKDGIEIDMKWVVTTTFLKHRYIVQKLVILATINFLFVSINTTVLFSNCINMYGVIPNVNVTK